MIKKKIEHVGLMLSYDILEKRQKDFSLQNSFSYSADVKPIINKNQFEFI